jgi:hypothetical protein
MDSELGRRQVPDSEGPVLSDAPADRLAQPGRESLSRPGLLHRSDRGTQHACALPRRRCCSRRRRSAALIGRIQLSTTAVDLLHRRVLPHYEAAGLKLERSSPTTAGSTAASCSATPTSCTSRCSGWSTGTRRCIRRRSPGVYERFHRARKEELYRVFRYVMLKRVGPVHRNCPELRRYIHGNQSTGSSHNDWF